MAHNPYIAIYQAKKAIELNGFTFSKPHQVSKLGWECTLDTSSLSEEDYTFLQRVIATDAELESFHCTAGRYGCRVAVVNDETEHKCTIYAEVADEL